MCSAISSSPDGADEVEEEESIENQTQTQTLIPSLPNDISSLILSYIPYSHHSRLKPTSKSWNAFFSSTNKTLFTFRQSQPNLTSHLLCIFPQDPSFSPPYLFDPRNLAWRPLPPMPCSPHTYALSNFLSVSIAHHLYVLGGSLFDARSFPIDRPCSSAAAFRLDLSTFAWRRLSPMISPRGSFACAATPAEQQQRQRILVAGGGSRHTMFGAAGSRMNSVEMYDVEKDEWIGLEGLPRFRAGCVGFLVGEEEFWVMGGYGESRTVSGVFPVDEYYRDGVVLELRNNCWREIGDMWEEGERRRLGTVAVVDGNCGGGDTPGVFMLDGSDIFR